MVLSVFLLLNLCYLLPQPPSDVLVGTLIGVGATVFFCWWGARLKQVSIDQHNLYVAIVFKEISIPFSGIYSIDCLQNGWPAIVRLKEKSEFGRTILFLAEWRPLLLGSPHPILQQLRQLINENQNN